ncbi:hypothetical protein C0992_004893 [Termitomyces sp. T32_za158]|nr:hypothetical protein C0992_004893 [Termitomyces sp. T32_za158]
MSASTVKHRRQELGLKGPWSTKKSLDPAVGKQIVVDEMANDLSRHTGSRMMQQRIAFHTGVQLTCDFVNDVMHNHDAEGFVLCNPTSKRVFRVKKFPVGIHHCWAADGHDKLYKIGFPIWAIIEDATSNWLDA